MRIDFLTIFPEIFPPVLGTSILRIAAEKGLVEYHVHDIRAFTKDPHRKVDDRPYGGGPGMVMMAQPVVDAVEAVETQTDERSHRILLSPQGRRLNQQVSRELAQEKRLLLICGRYEGFDERIREVLQPDEISIGDYILSGGELPALVIAESVVRLIPGVLGDPDSALEESFTDRLLDCPHYTRPPEYRGLKVPDVLLSGHHAAIREWRLEQAKKRTRERRPDLLDRKEQE